MLQELQKALHGEGDLKRGKMTESQVNAFHKIQDAVNGRNMDKLYFLKARGGTGKTVLLNRILYYIRFLHEDSVALSVAFTGIAATLLQRGRTFNSRFRFPIKADGSTTCNITKGSGLARLTKNAK